MSPPVPIPSPGTPLLKKSLKLALIQLSCGSSKSANLARARSKVLEAAAQGANIVVLPECFNSPYGTKYFAQYAEELRPRGKRLGTGRQDGEIKEEDVPSKEQAPTWHALRDMARESGCWVVGGSIPERVVLSETDADSTTRQEIEQKVSAANESKDTASTRPLNPNEKLYNTSLTFSPSGSLACTHRKVHLFDISIPGKITFQESLVLSPGNKVSLFHIPDYGTVAVAICYDIRFPELATIAARHGAFLLLYPGAFNLTTGALHWELQARARAMDNQVFVGLCSPARDMTAEYHAWGHSLVADPNAEVLGMLDEKEGILMVELKEGRIEEVRSGIPITKQRRFDVYPDVSQGNIRWTEDE